MSNSARIVAHNQMNCHHSQPLLLTYQQAAELLGVSDRTVWQLVKDGKLPAVRFAGHTVRIDRRDLEVFIERSKAGQEVDRD